MDAKRLMNKKGEFKLRTWVVAFLLFSGIFAILFLSSSDLINDYGQSGIIEDRYKNNYDKFTNTSDDFRDLSVAMRNQSSVWDILNPLSDAGIIQAFFSVVTLTFDSITTLDDITSQFMVDFGVPEGIANVIFPLLSAILIVVIIFIIISNVSRGSPV